MSAPDMNALQARVARFKDLKSSAEAFIDTRIPEFQREIFNIIGRGVTEDDRLQPPITDNRDFNLCIMKADPGKGSSAHDHLTIECFIPLNGRWAIELGENGEEAIVLDVFDVFSVPPGVMRAVKNIGEEPAMILTILGGTDPGRAIWSERAYARGRELGLSLDSKGNIIRD